MEATHIRAIDQDFLAHVAKVAGASLTAAISQQTLSQAWSRSECQFVRGRRGVSVWGIKRLLSVGAGWHVPVLFSGTGEATRAIVLLSTDSATRSKLSLHLGLAHRRLIV